MKKKLYRSDSDKVLGGVFGGLSIRFGVSALPMRLIAIILMFSLGFFPIFLIYCIAWAIIPLPAARGRAAATPSCAYPALSPWVSSGL